MAFFCAPGSEPISARTRSARRFSSNAFSYSGAAAAICGNSSVCSSRRRYRSLFKRKWSRAGLRLKSERQRRREEQTEEFPQFAAAAPEYEKALDEKRRAERVRALIGSLPGA